MFGTFNMLIGEEKTCRFCLIKPENVGKFGKKAHAISEALGNKLITSKQECDDGLEMKESV